MILRVCGGCGHVVDEGGCEEHPRALIIPIRVEPDMTPVELVDDEPSDDDA